VFPQAQAIEDVLVWQSVFPNSNTVLTRRYLKESRFPVYAQRESGLGLFDHLFEVHEYVDMEVGEIWERLCKI
jgi:hypothetical protein